MNGTSRQIFELAKPLPDLVLQPLRAVSETLNSLGFPYFLVGATARAVILENVFGRSAGRLTQDLDFGVALSNWEQFESLRAAFIKTRKFEATPSAQRLLYMYSAEIKIKIDLIPFGGIQDGASSIAWPPTHDVVRNVAGFNEAIESAVLVRADPDFVIPVASLAGLIILKLFAWVDRKQEKRDAPDILRILADYGDAGNEERLFEQELVLLEAAGFDVPIAGAFLLGKDARFVANKETAAALQEVLRDEASREQLVNQMVQSGGRSDDAFALQCESLLDHFRKGFSGEILEK